MELLTRGDETLGDAERLDDSCRIAAFLLEFRNDLGGGHIEGVLAFRELVDLVRNHVKDIKSLIRGCHRRRRCCVGRCTYCM